MLKWINSIKTGKNNGPKKKIILFDKGINSLKGQTGKATVYDDRIELPTQASLTFDVSDFNGYTIFFDLVGDNAVGSIINNYYFILGEGPYPTTYLNVVGVMNSVPSVSKSRYIVGMPITKPGVYLGTTTGNTGRIYRIWLEPPQSNRGGVASRLFSFIQRLLGGDR